MSEQVSTAKKFDQTCTSVVRKLGEHCSRNQNEYLEQTCKSIVSTTENLCHIQANLIDLAYKSIKK